MNNKFGILIFVAFLRSWTIYGKIPRRNNTEVKLSMAKDGRGERVYQGSEKWVYFSKERKGALQ